MDKRNVTIYEVAQEAGVSVATVSRVLNSGRVAPETRRRVLEAMDRLGYLPNTLARSLATGTSRAVGVIIPDAAGPLYGRMLRGVGDALEAAGYTYITGTSARDPDREARMLRDLGARKVDAVVLIGSSLDGSALRALGAALPPVVLVEREGGGAGAPAVTVDNEGAAYAATRYLIARGHTRIAHVRGPRRAGQERYAGYRRALREAGLAEGPVVSGDFSELGGYRAMRALLERPGFTAVFLANDRMALGAYKALREAGVRVPEEVSVVGFDDLVFAAYLDPPLTTLRQPAYELGRAAAKAVLACLDGAVPANVVLSCELVPRASVMER
ncbi:LacI family DNA-binding transcriptional regulator [Marinithermus hydrothermalis]|uniref:Transcriptional regulator, LacI family n=1 Tax=Marinithermus hydrothermalis (strain DSM 14884 / JCM 11576 / T1) TaxID=869210 RepID=F2NL27_MARHT|nr:LacI family DNA-binding transcriptional regulator [Marinithermus hydrothermalis]AEB11430.1 transcriptional regulator, LacI family [Marinithermus hydrothermalis DSM 14884]